MFKCPVLEKGGVGECEEVWGNRAKFRGRGLETVPKEPAPLAGVPADLSDWCGLGRERLT